MLSCVLKNSLAMFLSNIILRFGDFVFVVFGARWLSPDDFGTVMLALSFYSLFKLAGDGGLQHLLVRDMAQNKPRMGQYFGDAVLFQAVWSALLALVYVAAVLILGYPSGTTLALLIALIALVPDNLTLPATSAIQAAEHMEYLVIANVISVALRMGLSIGVLLAGYGFVAVMLCLVVGRLVGLFTVQYLAVTRITRPAGGARWSELRLLVSRLRPFLAIAVLSAVFLRADVVILSRMADNQAVASFSTAIRAVEPALLIVGSFALAIYPTLSISFADKKGGMPAVYSGALRTVTLGMMALICVGDVLAKPMIELLFPAEYSESVLVVRVFLWYLGFFAVDQVNNRVLMVIGRQRVSLRSISIGTVMVLTLAIPFVSWWGAVGAAIADLVAMATMTILDLWVVWRAVRGVDLRGILAPPLLATVVVWSIGQAASPFGWSMQLLLVIPTLVALSWCLHLIRVKDVIRVRAVFRGYMMRRIGAASDSAGAA